MKKLVAVLLSMSMILALAACGSKSEETKKKKKKKTKKTTAQTETIDPTDIPSVPTDDPTTDTSDPVPTTPVQKDLVISHDLEKLGINRNISFLNYGAVCEDDDYDGLVMSSCSLYFEDYTALNGDGYNANTTLENVFSNNKDDLIQTYELHRDEFIKEEDEGLDIYFYNLISSATFYRADSQVMSFAYYEGEFCALEERFDYEQTFVNTCPSRSNPEIGFDEVILDPDGLIDYASTVFYNDHSYVLDELAEKIRNKEVCFAMTYDGIILGDEKFSVVGHEEIFNMEWFGSTPKDYSLILDTENKLTWDFNSDGTLEELACQYDEQSGTILISLGNETYSFTESEIPGVSMNWGIDYNNNSVVMTTVNGSFLYLILDQSETYKRTYVFKVSDGSVEYIQDKAGYPFEDVCDPMNFDFYEYMHFLGDKEMYVPMLLGQDGELIIQTSSNYDYSSPYLVMTDIKGQEFDWNTGELIGDYTIKADTIVSVIAYSQYNGSLVLMPLTRDMTLDNQKFILVETDRESTVAGKPFADVFGGQFMAVS